MKVNGLDSTVASARFQWRDSMTRCCSCSHRQNGTLDRVLQRLGVQRIDDVLDRLVQRLSAQFGLAFMLVPRIRWCQMLTAQYARTVITSSSLDWNPTTRVQCEIGSVCSRSAREACCHAPALDAKHDAVRDDLVAATAKQWSGREQARRIHQPVDLLFGVPEIKPGLIR